MNFAEMHFMQMNMCWWVACFVSFLDGGLKKSLVEVSRWLKTGKSKRRKDWRRILLSPKEEAVAGTAVVDAGSLQQWIPFHDGWRQSLLLLEINARS